MLGQRSHIARRGGLRLNDSFLFVVGQGVHETAGVGHSLKFQEVENKNLNFFVMLNDIVTCGNGLPLRLLNSQTILAILPLATSEKETFHDSLSFHPLGNIHVVKI